MIRTYNGKEYPNRQLSKWIFILYPESNETHKQCIDILSEYPNTLLMKHDRSYDSEGNKKETHYHCLMKFDNPYWLYTLVDRLNLENDSLHLFKSLKECKYKNMDDWIIYVTHIKEEDKENYSAGSFIGGLREYAISVINKLDKKDSDLFKACLQDLEIMTLNPDFRFYTYYYIYCSLCDMGHEYIVYKKFNMLKSFIDDYKIL